MPVLYDLMLLLDPNAPEQSQKEVLRSVESMIESSGTIVGHHDWGVRRIAFEIDHRPEAAYHLFQLETDDAGLLERIDHSLKIADGVLRFRIIRLKPGSPPPATPRADSRSRDREERSDETRVAARAAADAPDDVAGEAPAEPAEGAEAAEAAEQPAEA